MGSEQQAEQLSLVVLIAVEKLGCAAADAAKAASWTVGPVAACSGARNCCAPCQWRCSL